MSKTHLQNRWLAIGLLLLCSGCIALLWHGYLNQKEHWPLKQVQIQGTLAHLDKAKLHQQVVDAIQGSFFSVDMTAVREALLAEPWVADVGIRRIWPDTLRIQIKEQKPVARWLISTQQIGLVNRRGEIFYPSNSAELSHLPLFGGAQHKAPVMVHFYYAIRNHAAQKALQIQALHLNARKEWRIQFDNALQLVLSEIDYQQHWHDFMQIYTRLVKQGKPARIDMRYANGIAVRWSDSSAAQKIDTLSYQGKGEG